MDQRLIDVSKTGDVDAFYVLLGEDQYILESIDIAPFVDTPLHIAIVAKKTDFAVEIANLKPSFARKLNQAGCSPIHLASTYGNLKIVRKLLSIDHELCLLEGRGDKIPLHFAAEAGKVHVMKALLKACPDSIGMLTVREETPLHLAAKNGQVEACRVLLESIRKHNSWELIYWKDKYGNTAVDVAAGSPEVVDLFKSKRPILETNFILAKVTRKVKAWILEKPVTNDSRSAMLVVLAVIIAALFQAVVSPPGGVWQSTITNSNSTANTTTTTTTAIAHYAGKAVMGHQYIRFARINTVGFCASIVAITLLTNDIPFILQLLLMCCIGPMMIIYQAAITIINPEEYRTFGFFANGATFTFKIILLTFAIFLFTIWRRLRLIRKLITGSFIRSLAGHRPVRQTILLGRILE